MLSPEDAVVRRLRQDESSAEVVWNNRRDLLHVSCLRVQVWIQRITFYRFRWLLWLSPTGLDARVPFDLLFFSLLVSVGSGDSMALMCPERSEINDDRRDITSWTLPLTLRGTLWLLPLLFYCSEQRHWKVLVLMWNTASQTCRASVMEFSKVVLMMLIWDAPRH